MKRTELQQIKKEKQLAGETEEQQTCLLAVPEEGDASKKLQRNKKSAMINKEQACLLAIKEENDCSKNLQLKKKKEKKRKRSELEKSQVPADTEDLASDTYCPQRWRASYSLLLRQLLTKPHKGSVLLDAKVNRIILHDIDEEVIDACDLKEGELIYPGLMLDFPCHKVEIGEPILQSKEDSPLPKVVSGSSYPTANRYFHEMWSVKLLLEKHAKNKNKEIASMVSEMKKKFDKYWTETYLANCIPVVFDPRYKIEFVKFRIKQAFVHNAGEHLEKVEIIIKSLFEEYCHEMGGSFDDHSEEVGVDEVAEIDNPLADWEAHLKVQKKQETSELDSYLSEELFPQEKKIDILEWWEMHSPKYPVLSRIARDVLAIQASTVASESSFSAGGRIISDHRNRLKSDTVEALICLQDWLNAADPKPTNKDVEEEECLVFYQGSECHEVNNHIANLQYYQQEFSKLHQRISSLQNSNRMNNVFILIHLHGTCGTCRRDNNTVATTLSGPTT